MSNTADFSPAASYLRPGFPGAVPTLRVRGASDLMMFLEEGLGATLTDVTLTEGGTLQYAVARVGASAVIEVSEATERFGPMAAAVHLYVPDVDEAHARVMAQEGTSELHGPEQMPYGERSSAVEDRWGNHWYLATWTE